MPLARRSTVASLPVIGDPNLDALLADLVAGVRSVLGHGLVGVYLQGSFALGAWDEWSDVDFVVVTEEQVRDLAPLDALHARLYERETPWAQHLEGSYLPRELLRRVDPERTPMPFLDNGARTLALDAHCNSAVVRWILRRHGIVLDGPPPADLVDPVAPDDLRAEGRTALREYVEWSREAPATRWVQPYLVLTLCRILRTIACADVVSKRASAEWALQTLDERWHSLIRAAVAGRPHPWERVRQPADPALWRETLAFALEVGSSGA
jgi:predicted nucleotidyltransferase